MSTQSSSLKPLSERKIKHYLNKNLLSLPDEVLNQIASYLLPVPPQNPPTVTSLRHALSLSQTCQRFHNIVISRLHTLDFLGPSSYKSPTCRTPHHVSSQLERFIKSASKHLQDLRLPQGYVPSDDHYTVISNCKNLTHLSLPVSRLLDAGQAQALFSSFDNLQSITLDLPSPSFLIGLCHAPLDLKQVSFSKLPAGSTSFTALSAFLITKGPNLTSLSINLLCDDTKLVHYATKYPWVCLQDLLPPKRALPRLSAVLQRHVESNELPVLEELDVSTMPDALRGGETYEISDWYTKITLFTQAIKRTRLENSQPKGLKKLRMRIQPDCRHSCIAFMSSWIDPRVDVEVSFPDITLSFPRDSSEGTVVTKVKEVMLWLHATSLDRVLTDVKFEIETLGIGNELSFYSNKNPYLPDLSSFIQMAHGEKVQTLRITYDIPKGAAFRTLRLFLDCTAQLLPTLTTLELPAEVVLFSASADAGLGLVSNSKDSIKILRLYGFRDPKVRILDGATAVWLTAVRQISIDTYEQKASWFLKCLPAFLRLLRKDFPNLELLYMEQTVVEPFDVDRGDLSRAMFVIDRYERFSGVDASTLRTEIMEWRRRPTLATDQIAELSTV